MRKAVGNPIQIYYPCGGYRIIYPAETKCILNGETSLLELSSSTGLSVGSWGVRINSTLKYLNYYYGHKEEFINYKYSHSLAVRLIDNYFNGVPSVKVEELDEQKDSATYKIYNLGLRDIPKYIQDKLCKDLTVSELVICIRYLVESHLI